MVQGLFYLQKQSILSNETTFRDCDIQYKAKLNEIVTHKQSPNIIKIIIFILR